jgi:hypothetical protein
MEPPAKIRLSIPEHNSERRKLILNLFARGFPLSEKVTLVILLTLTFSLRSYAMGTRDLGLDEVFSFMLAQNHTLLDLVSPLSTPLGDDAHPPLYYLITKTWLETGYPLLHSLGLSQEYSFRFPYALLGTATMLFLYRTGKGLGSQASGVWLAFLYALNSFSIQIAHHSRMYPLVEFLAAVLFYSWLNLRIGFSRRQGALFLMASVLALLIHYATVFYLSALFMTLFLSQRRSAGSLLGMLLLAILCFSWWLPVFFTQVRHETLANNFASSTGAIVLLTLFHFFTGDRGLALGGATHLTSHLYTLASFSIGMVLACYLLWKNRQETGSSHLLAICLLPLGLHWSATFVVQRVYNATYYAIYALPVFLGIFAQAMSRKDSSFLYLRRSLLLIIILVNGITLVSFFRNTMAPYEPWKQVCAVLRAFEPTRVFIYPSHMSAMLTFYGADLPAEGIDFHCGAQEAEIEALSLLGKLKPGHTVLVLSHDWGKGDCLAAYFREVLVDEPREFEFPNIRLFLFRNLNG